MEAELIKSQRPSDDNEAMRGQLPDSSRLTAFTSAMTTLCCLKRTAELTESEIHFWFAVLESFRPQTVNRAVIELGTCLERFPELADVLQACRRIEPPKREYTPMGDGPRGDRLTRIELKRIAEKLGLDIT